MDKSKDLTYNLQSSIENYHSGDKSLADAGWRIFSVDQLAAKLEASLEEALWLIERACLSQSLYLEIRLRFLDRFVLPAVMHIVKESKLNRPPLTEYRNGVKAPLIKCLSLTLNERLQQLDFSQIKLVLR